VTSTLDSDSTDTAKRVETLEREVRRYRISRDAWTFTIFGIAIVAAIASIVGVGIALRDDGDGESGATIQAELT